MSSRDEIIALLKQGGKFEVLEQIEGGMNGYAFRAIHLPLNREVFLKVCDADSDSKSLFQEPQSLINATKSSNATNLVRLFDAEKLGSDFILMAMEWADGGSLLGAINNGIGQRDAIGFAIEILHGISVLHSARLLHRDIKPANILLSWAGNKYIPKVGDFGSAASLPEGSATISASRHSALYVPPEGWQIPSAYGVRSDLYQVGMVLDEMVNGTLPYDMKAYLDKTGISQIKSGGFSRFEDMDACDCSKLINECIARRSVARTILTMRPTLPYESKSLRRIIKKATAPAPSQRFSNATEFVAALQRLDLPNWRSTANGYEAMRWRDWDWKIETVSSKVLIYRKRSKISTYRSCGNNQLSLQDAFSAVESF